MLTMCSDILITLEASTSCLLSNFLGLADARMACDIKDAIQGLDYALRLQPAYGCQSFTTKRLKHFASKPQLDKSLKIASSTCFDLASRPATIIQLASLADVANDAFVPIITR